MDEQPGKWTRHEEATCSNSLTTLDFPTTHFHLHEASANGRAGDITCWVDNRSNTSYGQLRHRCADGALSSGQPLDDATALDQQETSATEERLHQNPLNEWDCAAVSRH